MISDEKTINSLGMAYPNLSYFAEVRNLNSYYAYGKDLPTGTYSSSGSYSYGFNGKERESHKDGQYDFGARIMNTEFPMFLSRDPLEKKFAFQSPYLFASNNPILLVDKDGEAAAFGQIDVRGNFAFYGPAGGTASMAIGVILDHNLEYGVYLTVGGGPSVGAPGFGYVAGVSYGGNINSDSYESISGWGGSYGGWIAAGTNTTSFEINLAENGNSDDALAGFTKGKKKGGYGKGGAFYGEMNYTWFLFEGSLKDDFDGIAQKIDEALQEQFGMTAEELNVDLESLVTTVQAKLNEMEQQQSAENNQTENAEETQDDLMSPSSSLITNPESSDTKTTSSSTKTSEPKPEKETNGGQ